MLSIYLENKKVVSNRSVLGLGRKVRPGTSQNHDPIHGCCGPVTHHVVDAYGGRSDEAACHPRARRHGQLSAACVNCDSRDLHLATRKRIVAKGNSASSIKRDYLLCLPVCSACERIADHV